MRTYIKSMNPSHLATLNGHLEKTIYYNEENHYTIARFSTGETQNLVTVVGYLAGVNPGEALKITGAWETHPKYGQQFKIDSFEVTLPATFDGIRKYLESGIIKGIGKKMAGKMVSRFKDRTLEMIEKSPEKLLEIEGIGKAKAARITNAWKEHHAIRNLMQFLQEMGVKISYSAKILKEYGRDAADIIRKDPYRLAKDLPGAGFFIADTIARKLGLPKDDPERINACVIHLIEQSISEGNVFTYEDQLLKKSMNHFQLAPDVAKKALDTLADSGDLVTEEIGSCPDTIAVYPKSLHEAETGIATRLRALLSVPVTPSEIDSKRIAAEVQKKLAIVLSSEQLAVLEEILSHRAVIITGGPGTGKTTLIKSITAILEARGEQFLLAAPTGRAARRISEVARRKAATIHKLLGYNLTNGLFDKNQNNPLDAYAVIIDEASMVDTLLMYHLLKAVPMTSVLILVGDVFQLPPIGPGNVLADMIKSEIIPAFHLKKIFRQDQESPIVLNAHKVRRGELPDLKRTEDPEDLTEFYFIEQKDPDIVVQTIVELCRERIPKRFNLGLEDVQVLTPMHKGKVGTINLNHVLQKVLNSNPAIVESHGNLFKMDDKVMHLINNYQKEVFNGDIGTISSIDNAKKEILVDYYGRTVPYDFEELEELSLAYAISVHKSQGSEYPGVIVPIMTQHFALLQRNLLYTAITRGKKLVILIGTQKALTIALKNDKPQQRLSRLADRLNPRAGC